MKNSTISLIWAIFVLAFITAIGVFMDNPYPLTDSLTSYQSAQMLNFAVIKGFVMIAAFMLSLTLFAIGYLELVREKEKK